jgi:hypothetical protein
VKPLALDEIAGPERYEALRADFRAAVIAHKRQRRLAVGEKVTLVFEDRETLRFQVQEMLRVERIRDPVLVQKELDVYNELMPGPRELSATLFVEITDAAQIRPELDRLIGIDEHVALVLGDGKDEEQIRARFDPKQMEEDRISAVQYIRFRLDPAQVERFADLGVPAGIRIDHPHYTRETGLPPAVRASLIGDLTREPEPLLPLSASEAGAPAGGDAALVFARGRVRVLRPAEPLGPGHRIVEVEPAAGLLEADAALHAEVLAVVLELARDVRNRHGRCRIQADADAPDARLRWHVLAAPR